MRRALLAEQFGITQITVQCELEPCHQADEEAAEHVHTPRQVLEAGSRGAS